MEAESMPCDEQKKLLKAVESPSVQEGSHGATITELDTGSKSSQDATTTDLSTGSEASNTDTTTVLSTESLLDLLVFNDVMVSRDRAENRLLGHFAENGLQKLSSL